MKVVKSVRQVRIQRLQNRNLAWGFVPTMGALHAGHTSLITRAKGENDRVGVSIFVNPTQFTNAADLKNYPHTLKNDLRLLRAAGADLVFTPEVSEVYPRDFQTYIEIEKVTRTLEGAARPGHFRGMATVVTKLFNMFEPTRAYFGQKDAQQVVVVQQIVRDLNMNMKIVVCPTIREHDGLAMSSRNVKLNPQERKAAAILYESLKVAHKKWNAGLHDANTLRKVIRTVLKSESRIRIDYVSVTDPQTLVEINGHAKRALISLAVYIGRVRLIDNIIV